MPWQEKRLREGISSLYSALTELPLDTVFSFGPVMTRKPSKKQTEFSGGMPRRLGLQHLCCVGRVRDGAVKPEEEMAFEGDLTAALPVPMGGGVREGIQAVPSSAWQELERKRAHAENSSRHEDSHAGVQVAQRGWRLNQRPPAVPSSPNCPATIIIIPGYITVCFKSRSNPERLLWLLVT